MRHTIASTGNAKAATPEPTTADWEPTTRITPVAPMNNPSHCAHRTCRPSIGPTKEHLDKTPEPGVDRVLSVFDAAALWYQVHGAKGCSAVNARAETAPEADGHFVFPEVSGQKVWMLNLFTDLCAQAGCPDPAATAKTLMLLFEGALVTLGMRTFAQPVEEARTAARAILIASIHQKAEDLQPTKVLPGRPDR